jgi:hypothetical protein
MIIKSNLASNPVRNHTLFLLSCLALIVLVGVFSVLNIRFLTASFRRSSELELMLSAQLRERADMQRQSNDLKHQISMIKTQRFVSETEFLNNAIKKRVFSWTTLFDRFEKVFPDNVKMVSVFPNIRDEDISISMEVAGKSLNDLLQLIDRLQKAGVFSDVVFRSERQDTSDGLIHAAITLLYLPEPAAVGKAKQQPAVKPAAVAEKRNGEAVP